MQAFPPSGVTLFLRCGCLGSTAYVLQCMFQGLRYLRMPEQNIWLFTKGILDYLSLDVSTSVLVK